MSACALGLSFDNRGVFRWPYFKAEQAEEDGGVHCGSSVHFEAQLIGKFAEDGVRPPWSMRISASSPSRLGRVWGSMMALRGNCLPAGGFLVNEWVVFSPAA